MSVTLIPFEPHHLRLITPQPAQEGEFQEQQGAPAGQAWTAVVDGLPICVGGLTEIWRGRAYAWALLTVDAGPHMLGLTREIRSTLDRATFARIEMVVEKDFLAGRRWAEMLGFSLETPEALRCFLPSGRDAWIYSRIK
ncbi:MAG TPA: hypothetical protein VIP05_35490 [Burkholderiaceae bacterium]